MSKRQIKLKRYEECDSISKPVIVSFPQNIPPKCFFTELNEKNEPNPLKLNFVMYEHKNQNLNKHVIEAENSLENSMKYRGKSITPDNNQKHQISDYIVGIFDKETNKIKLIDVDYYFALTQTAKAAEAYKPIKDNMYEGVEYYEQKNQLVNVFGTKKARQKMLQMKPQDVDTAKQMEKVLKHNVQKLIENESKNVEDEDESYAKDVLPSNDPHTKDVDEVYRKESIIPNDLKEFILFKDLHRMMKSGKQLTEEQKEQYEKTTIHCMKYLVEEEKVNPKIKHHKFRVRAAIYMTYLLRFYRLGNVIRMNTKEIEDNCGIPKDIGEKILNAYAELTVAKDDSHKKFHYIRNKKMQDKLLCHIIVLLLIIRDYKIDVKWIISSLKIQFEKLVPYLRLISCFPKKSKQAEESKDEDEEKNKVKAEGKKYKNEWALDTNGSLMVYLKAPLRMAIKDNKGK